MPDAFCELKIRAKILHKKNLGNSPNARLRDSLNAVATQWGFSGYLPAKAMLSGALDAAEFGTLLYPKHGPTLNRWYSHYKEAVEERHACNGFLLAWKTQFLVVGFDYIESLGLDPHDPDWDAMGRDWVKPASVSARTRLYGKLVSRLPRS